jgi:hypothetical protein
LYSRGNLIGSTVTDSTLKEENGFEKGTLSLVLSWDADASGRVFQAIVPLCNLRPDGRDDISFSSIEALKLCSPRRGVKVKLLEVKTIEGEPTMPGHQAPLLLQFTVKIPIECGAQENRVLAVVGRVVRTGLSSPSQPMHPKDFPAPTRGVSCFRLTTAHGESVVCTWQEVLLAK